MVPMVKTIGTKSERVFNTVMDTLSRNIQIFCKGIQAYPIVSDNSFVDNVGNSYIIDRRWSVRFLFLNQRFVLFPITQQSFVLLKVGLLVEMQLFISSVYLPPIGQ